MDIKPIFKVASYSNNICVTVVPVYLSLLEFVALTTEKLLLFSSGRFQSALKSQRMLVVGGEDSNWNLFDLFTFRDISKHGLQQ